MAEGTFKFFINMFKLLFLIIFMYQMFKATDKFIQGPVYNEKSKINLKDFHQPVVYICSKAPFNYTAAARRGYSKQEIFMLGYLHESNITSWKGSPPATSDIIHELFNDDLDHLNFTLNRTKVFRAHEGLCYRSEEYKFEDMLLSSTSKIGYIIYLIDPYMEIPFLIELPNFLGQEMEINRVNKDFRSWQTFDVRFSVHDQMIKDGKDCIDYTSKNSSYGQCIYVATRDYLINLLGCLPPWFLPGKGNCTQMKRIEGETRKKFASLVHTILYKRPLNIFPNCKPSCLQMSYKVTEVSERRVDGAFNTNFITLYIHSEATLNKVTLSYDAFALIVEIGSALGLWIGLSALGIIDHGFRIMLDCINYLKRKAVKQQHICIDNQIT